MKIKFMQRLITKYKEKRKANGINKIIKRYKFIHIMFNDKFNKPFVDFLNRNFDTKEHLILCKRWHKYPFPRAENVIEIQTLKNLNFSNAEKIFCHSLFDSELVDYLYNHQDILKEKSYWQVWGGDLYEAPRDEKNDFVRENIFAYITGGDRNIIIGKYGGGQKRFFSASYIFPVGLDILNVTKKHKHKELVIQINNSCDYTTIEMLHILSKFKDRNIRIITILSYGNLEFKNNIMDIGKQVFGDKFNYINEMLSPSEYAQHLANIDILILNQRRQQGVGNTQASLYLGNKVFIRSDVTTYKDFNDLGIKIYDSKDIVNLNFDDFSSYPERKTNKQLVKNLIDESILRKSWKQIFSG